MLTKTGSAIAYLVTVAVEVSVSTEVVVVVVVVVSVSVVVVSEPDVRVVQTVVVSWSVLYSRDQPS